MNEMILFPMSEYWWFYLGYIAFVFAMLALDLGVFHKNSHEVSFIEATTWSIVWVTIAMIFNAGLYYYTLSRFPETPEIAKQISLEFLTGYVIEKSLSVDNIFVFVVVFSFFSVPSKYQHRVLFYGIAPCASRRGRMPPPQNSRSASRGFVGRWLNVRRGGRSAASP